MATAPTPRVSEGARLVMLELAADPGTPISSYGLADLFADSFTPRQIGAWLRELRVAGLAEPLDARTLQPLDSVPSGVRVVWQATQ